MTKDDPITGALVDKFFGPVINAESEEALRDWLKNQSTEEIERFLNYFNWTNFRDRETILRQEIGRRRETEIEGKVGELERQRFAFLKELYDRSGGDSLPEYPAKDIGQKLGFDQAITEKIDRYLKAEGLLEYRSMGPQVAITHQGIKEIEQALKQPAIGTDHFPANIIIVGQMTDSQISQAGATATQTIECTAKKHGVQDKTHRKSFYKSAVFWAAVGSLAAVASVIIALIAS